MLLSYIFNKLDARERRLLRPLYRLVAYSLTYHRVKLEEVMLLRINLNENSLYDIKFMNREKSQFLKLKKIIIFFLYK